MDAGCSGERGFSSRFLCWVWPFARTTVIKPSVALSSLLAHNLSSSCLRYIYPLSLPPPLSLTDTCAHPMYTPHIHTYIHSTQVSLTPFRHAPAHSLYSLRLTPASARMCLQRHVTAVPQSITLALLVSATPGATGCRAFRVSILFAHRCLKLCLLRLKLLHLCVCVCVCVCVCACVCVLQA